MNLIDDPTRRVLWQSLDVLSRRQQVSLHNIANIDTPGYKARAVSFQAELANLRGDLPLAVTHSAHISPAVERSPILVTEAAGTSWRNDGNNVDVERELTSLAETTIAYSAITQQITAKLAGLRRVITEGRS